MKPANVATKLTACQITAAEHKFGTKRRQMLTLQQAFIVLTTGYQGEITAERRLSLIMLLQPHLELKRTAHPMEDAALDGLVEVAAATSRGSEYALVDVLRTAPKKSRILDRFCDHLLEPEQASGLQRVHGRLLGATSRKSAGGAASTRCSTRTTASRRSSMRW